MARERFAGNALLETARETSFVWKQSFLRPLVVGLPKDLEGNTKIAARFDRSLFALANGETKPTILLYGLTLTPARASAVVNRVQDALPGVLLPNATNVRINYLQNSFCPPGIAREFVQGSGFYYASAPEAEAFTKPVAAHLLKYTADNNIAVSKVLGSVQNDEDTDVRSHINRVALLLLLSQKPSYEAALADLTGIARPVVGGALRTLRDLGLIDYDYADMEARGWGVYERVGDIDQVQHSTTLNRLRRNVLEYFRLNTTANPQSLALALGRDDTSDVDVVLGELTDAGFLKRTKWYGGVQQSDAKINDEGRKFVDGCVLPILYAATGDSVQLKHLTQASEEIQDDPKLVERALAVYRTVAARTPREETASEIIGLISENGPARANQLIETFGTRAEPVFRDLLAEGRLIKYKIGKASYYALPKMPAPEPIREVVIFDYATPPEAVPLKERPKEAYRADFETQAFWQDLLRDVSTLEPGTVTERDFYHFYNPNNPTWRDKDDYRTGKYSRHHAALRKLGIRRPHEFIREYKPASKDPQLNSLAEQAKEAIKRQLIETKTMKHWDEYLQEFHTETFWEQLINDIEHAPSNIGMSSFLDHFSRDHEGYYDQASLGPYTSLYQMMDIYTENGVSFLSTFSPSLPHTRQLEALVHQAQAAMREKFIFYDRSMPPHEWIAAMNGDEFWHGLRNDLAHFTDDTTFRNFMFFFNQDNTDLQRRKTDEGKLYLGKYYLLTQLFSQIPIPPLLADLPRDISPRDAMKWYIFRKAPADIKDMLLLKFSEDFISVDNSELKRKTGVSSARLVDFPPNISGAKMRIMPQDIASALIQVDCLAGIPLEDKRGLLAAIFWYEDSEDMAKVAEVLGVNGSSVQRLVLKALDNPNIEELWSRFAKLQELGDPLGFSSERDLLPNIEIDL